MKCIVNVTENWGIGREDRLLVSLSADLRRFRQLTEGRTVILGRKTLATFPGGRPLPRRRNLVLSSDRTLEVPGAEVVHSLSELFAVCRDVPDDDLCVIGGARVYEQLRPYCRQALVTRTLLSPAADRFFPDLDRLPGWSAVRRGEVLEENGVSFQYVEYVNAAPQPRVGAQPPQRGGA